MPEDDARILSPNGPRGFDVGWCRLDLYLLYGEHIADVFLDSYQTASRSALVIGNSLQAWPAAGAGPGAGADDKGKPWHCPSDTDAPRGRAGLPQPGPAAPAREIC